MLLADYVERFYLAERPGLSPGYRLLLVATVRKLCTWVGEAVPLERIERPLLARWASACLEAGERPTTVNGQVRRIRGLLLAAYDDGLLDRPPRRNRRIGEHHSPPEAWVIDEVARLLDYLRGLPGEVGRVPAADWWTATVLAVYWSGCRIGALLRVPAGDYRRGEGLLVARQKNGQGQWYPLPASCCAAIDRILPESGPVFAWPFHRRTPWLRFRRYVEAAGLPAPRGHCQLFHRLRRTTASYCAAEDPVIAQRQLGHADLRTTVQSYIDPRIARQRSAADVLPDPIQPPGKPRFRIVG